MKILMAVLLLSTPLFSQDTSWIDLSDPRPIAQALDGLEHLSGLGVHYEDVRYEHADDLEDVSDRVRNPEHKGPPTRVVIPKGRAFSFSFPVDGGRLADTAAVERALDGLLTANNAASMPGRFQVHRYGQGDLFLLPTSVRGMDGAAKTYFAVLSTPISVLGGKMSGAGALGMILKKTSEASGQRIEVGMVPFGALSNTVVSLEEEQRPAASILAELLSKLGGQYAIRMLYGPDVRYYAFNLRSVARATEDAVSPPEPPQEQTSAPPSKSASDNRWFRPAQ